MRGFAAWASERFPLVHGVAALGLYVLVLIFTRALVLTGPIRLGFGDLPGFFAVWSFFLTLRVLDEHKDYEDDCRFHPQRVLQRGTVTLHQLKVAGVAAVCVQAAVSLWRDGGIGAVTLWWLGTMAWAGLMAAEFFQREWLRRRLLVYAVSHMLIMPLAVLWIAQLSVPGAVLTPPIWRLAAFAFMAGASFEIARKAKGPEEEQPGVDSYSLRLGAGGAAALLAALGITSMALLASMVALLVRAPLALGVCAVGAIAVVVAAAAYARHPSASARRFNETVVGLGLLLGEVTVAAVLLVGRGVLWI
ncbi:MAG TPA: hypothetical protein VJ813_16060 [Vicinamibacterales bacterium]|nr:hypothetical protein [Vicinamibacterales bacterium]